MFSKLLSRTPIALSFGELDDDLDIVVAPLKRAEEVLRPFSSGDQLAEPRMVCSGQRLASFIPMPLVGVDAANDHVVLQHRLSGDIGCGGSSAAATGADARKADNASGRDFLYGVGYDRSGTRAFNDDIWLEPDAGDSAGMVRGSQGAHQVRLETGINPIQNMNVQPALHSEHCREQADWTCARYKHSSWIPKGAPADRVDVFPKPL
jgi:hypothetical protein